jgi:hypothetical protein
MLTSSGVQLASTGPRVDARLVVARSSEDGLRRFDMQDHRAVVISCLLCPHVRQWLPPARAWPARSPVGLRRFPLIGGQN